MLSTTPVFSLPVLFLAMYLSISFCPAWKMSEMGIGGNCLRPWEFIGSKRGFTPCPVAGRSEAQATSGKDKIFKRLGGLGMGIRDSMWNKETISMELFWLEDVHIVISRMSGLKAPLWYKEICWLDQGEYHPQIFKTPPLTTTLLPGAVSLEMLTRSFLCHLCSSNPS